MVRAAAQPRWKVEWGTCRAFEPFVCCCRTEILEFMDGYKRPKHAVSLRVTKIPRGNRLLESDWTCIGGLKLTPKAIPLPQLGRSKALDEEKTHFVFGLITPSTSNMYLFMGWSVLRRCRTRRWFGLAVDTDLRP